MKIRAQLDLVDAVNNMPALIHHVVPYTDEAMRGRSTGAVLGVLKLFSGDRIEGHAVARVVEVDILGDYRRTLIGLYE